MEQPHQQTSQKQKEDKLLVQPRKTTLITALIGTNDLENPIVKKYLEEYEKYQRNYVEHLNSIPKKEVEVLPYLKPIDPESLYQIFIENFKVVNGKEFIESHNDFGSRKLARSLIAYFIGSTGFYRSPILNQKSKPNLEKGVAIFGDYGVGKSAIVETFHKIFKYAENHRLMVNDIEGTEQILGRYKLSFGYHTANSVVSEYEAINKSDRESDKEYKLQQFIKKHHYGFKNYDDVMSERTASSYGKIELFKDIFEERYSHKAKTIISLNYHQSSLDKTLDAFAEKYGERLYDRFFEMFNILELKGKSLRQ